MNGKTRYMAGYRAELEARHILEGESSLVIRSAASKGPFDLVAFTPTSCRLIQIKRHDVGRPNPTKAELEALGDLKVPSFVTKEIWVKVKRDGWFRTKLG